MIRHGNLEKPDDVTIIDTIEMNGRYLTKIFNFEAEQITTFITDYNQGQHISQQPVIQNFCDVQSDAEIERMRAELIKIGGKPPAKAASKNKIV